MSRARLLEVTLCCVLQVVLCGFSATQFNKDVGDSCRLLSGGTGVCREVAACDPSLLSREPPQPAVCARRGVDTIVCCPQAGPPPRARRSAAGSTAKQKCKEYRTQKLTGTILGGEKVKSIFDHPHMALLGYGNGPMWDCGGTLISDQFVLTAAHCLQGGKDRSPVSAAQLGFLDKRNRTEFGTLQEFRVVKTHVHPNRTERTKYADIALLQLDRPVNMTNAVSPACLYEDFTFDSKTAQAIGWGIDDTGAASDVLQKVTIPLIDFDACYDTYDTEPNPKLPQGIDNETQFCAGDTGKDTCQGDSGGPLQLYDTSGMLKIIGITSFGEKCGAFPGVYTRVSHYVPWIESIVWPKT